MVRGSKFFFSFFLREIAIFLSVRSSSPTFIPCTAYWGTLLHCRFIATKALNIKKTFPRIEYARISTEKCLSGKSLSFAFFENQLINYSKRASIVLPRTHQIVAMDCEFVGGPENVDLPARISIVDGNGAVLYDEHVKQPTDKEVVDYRSAISGVTKEQMDNGRKGGKWRLYTVFVIRPIKICI
jgi:hypothetical protein